MMIILRQMHRLRSGVDMCYRSYVVRHSVGACLADFGWLAKFVWDDGDRVIEGLGLAGISGARPGPSNGAKSP